jgi:hypothetical protein
LNRTEISDVTDRNESLGVRDLLSRVKELIFGHFRRLTAEIWMPLDPEAQNLAGYKGAFSHASSEVWARSVFGRSRGESSPN